MAEMLTVLPPENHGNCERLRKPPVFIEYTPDYKKAHGIDNEIDRLPKGQLERTPECDDFECNDMIGASYKAFKAPSPTEIIAAATIAKEVIDVITDAVRSGRNLYEAVMGWINSDKNKNMSDGQKVQAMQLANIMAKQVENKDSQKPLYLAA